MINIGVKTYDIRDFFDETFVKEYKEAVIDYRNVLDTELPTVKNDGNSTNNTDLIKWIEERTGKDFSYLYNHDKEQYQYDYKFVMAAYEYLDSINVDENWNLKTVADKKAIPNLSSLSLMYSPPKVGMMNHMIHIWDDIVPWSSYYFMTDKINEVCLKNLIEEFPYMCNSLDDIRWKTNEWFGHMIAMPKGAFMSIHRDQTDDRPFTILNYINTDRTLEDGGVYRYFIHKDFDVEDKDSVDWSKYPDYVFHKVVPMEKVKMARYKYHKQPSEYQDLNLFPKHNQYNIIPNYTTVNIMLHKNHLTKEEDEKYFAFEIPPRSGDYVGPQGIPHLVTKNKSDEVRYTVYRRVVWRDS
jgi:hypothetical protein